MALSSSGLGDNWLGYPPFANHPPSQSHSPPYATAPGSTFHPPLPPAPHSDVSCQQLEINHGGNLHCEIDRHFKSGCCSLGLGELFFFFFSQRTNLPACYGVTFPLSYCCFLALPPRSTYSQTLSQDLLLGKHKFGQSSESEGQDSYGSHTSGVTGAVMSLPYALAPSPPALPLTLSLPPIHTTQPNPSPPSPTPSVHIHCLYHSASLPFLLLTTSWFPVGTVQSCFTAPEPPLSTSKLPPSDFMVYLIKEAKLKSPPLGSGPRACGLGKRMRQK